MWSLSVCLVVVVAESVLVCFLLAFVLFVFLLLLLSQCWFGCC